MRFGVSDIENVVKFISINQQKRYRLLTLYPISVITSITNGLEIEMTNATTHYELAGRTMFAGITAPLAWKDTKSIEGVKIWARDERTGEYVRVLETGPTIWVDNEPQAWSSGNFETVEDAKKFAGMAYRYINKGRRA